MFNSGVLCAIFQLGRPLEREGRLNPPESPLPRPASRPIPDPDGAIRAGAAARAMGGGEQGRPCLLQL